MTTVKDQVLAALRDGGKTKEQLLAPYGDGNQMRGAASVIAYLQRSDQIDLRNGAYYLTGRPAKKIPQTPKPSKAKPDPWGLSTQGAIVGDEEPRQEPDQPAAPPLEWALWHDGDLLLRRGDVSVVLTEGERERLSAWLGRMAA